MTFLFVQDSAVLYLFLIVSVVVFWVDVMMSARTLIHLFRSLNPEMLQKKFRVSVPVHCIHCKHRLVHGK